MVQRRLSEAEVGMDRKSWERRNSEVVLYKTNRQLEPKEKELYHVKAVGLSSARGKRRMFEELAIKSSLHQAITPKIASKLTNYGDFVVKRRN